MAKGVIKADSYSVFFETTAFTALQAFLKKKDFSQLFILTDTNVKKHCLPLLLKIPALKKATIIVLKAGEVHKNLDSCQLVWDALTVKHADRDALLINLGGGVVSDIGGFCASVYKRGIGFINLPTTSLAMADASVGGKTGIDYHGFKNHIGTFCNPLAVFIYSGFCKTQSEREFNSGIAEILKAGFISFKKLAIRASASPGQHLDTFIHHAVSIKNRIVLKDPKEKGLRKILNFGHTVGHALESFYLGKKNQLLHGEAIAIGMICESWVAWQMGRMKEKDFLFVKDALGSLFKKVKLKEADFPEILHLMQQDKKNKNGRIRLAVASEPRKYLLNLECSKDLLRQSLEYYNRL
jgi:3-dehydroquinate synthase